MKITNKQKGFSLIELLIVVAIILIIAAIAIPNLLRARMAANESSAVGSLRTIVTSEFNYQQTYGIGYAPLTNLGSTAPCAPATLATSAAACLVDSQLSSGTKSGYNVTTPAPAAVGTSAAPNNTFTAVAVPTGDWSVRPAWFLRGSVRRHPFHHRWHHAAGDQPGAAVTR